ncbi:MAG: hypothetical protein ACQESF_01920 [Nanobdellota archaeon]
MQLPKENTGLFVGELYFAFFLLIVASIGLYSIASKVKAAWLYFVVFFAIAVFNTILIYVEENNKFTLTAAMLLLGIAGILFSTKQLRKKEQYKVTRDTHEPKPIIVDNFEPVKKDKKKPTKKKSKSTAKKTTKKVSKSTGKAKTSKKKTGNKKTTKKTTTKKKSKSTAKKTTKKASKSSKKRTTKK